jgi:hypothetical protein
MAEPHQRTQSGKLKPVARRSINDAEVSSIQKIQPVTIGIEDANNVKIEDTDDDDLLKYFDQTPTSLSDLHVDILASIAKECGITNDNAIDKDWRNTWNIGTWCIGNQVSASINIVQPNIAGCWISVACNRDDDFHDIINKYSNYTLEKSSCTATRSGTGYQIKGRWGLHAVTELRSLGIIKKEPIEFGTVNVCQSRIFIWLLVGKSSEYLCTLSQQSIILLAKYVPDYSLDIQEPTEAKNITLRMKNPQKVNDGSQLSITTGGWLQFNGRPDNVAQLYGALSIALRNIMKSLHLKPFLESLHYEVLPEDF